jgi:hypothetical protein
MHQRRFPDTVVAQPRSDPPGRRRAGTLLRAHRVTGSTTRAAIGPNTAISSTYAVASAASSVGTAAYDTASPR